VSGISLSRVVRIGAGAGYSGDRIEPAIELAERAHIDYLVFECLAERTIALAQQERRRDPARGYDPFLEARMRGVLPACRRRGIRVITNAGAANPVAAARMVAGIARELGLNGLRVAAVVGDDVLALVHRRAHEKNGLRDEGGERLLHERRDADDVDSALPGEGEVLDVEDPDVDAAGRQQRQRVRRRPGLADAQADAVAAVEALTDRGIDRRVDRVRGEVERDRGRCRRPRRGRGGRGRGRAAVIAAAARGERQGGGRENDRQSRGRAQHGA